jgi:hypothetical protein
VVVLLKLGRGRSSIIIGTNILFLISGLYFAHRILKQEYLFCEMTSLGICLLSALSFVVVRNVATPLTDIIFLGVAMPSLNATRYVARGKAGVRLAACLTASVLLTIIAIMVRRVGITLAPVVAHAVVSNAEIRRLSATLVVRVRLILIATLGIIAAGTAWLTATTYTLHDFVVASGQLDIVTAIFRTLSYRATELGAIVVNGPVERLPLVVGRVIPCLGLMAFMVTILGFSREFKKVDTVTVWLGSYIAVLLVWPYYDPRFWLPVLPFLIGFMVLAIRRGLGKTIVRTAAVLYSAAFVVMGITALMYSTRISLAGPRFPDVYAGGNLRNSYCRAFATCAGRTSADKVDPEIVHLLQTFR